MDVQIHDWRIKQMKTKWGGCNIEARRLQLNLELAKKPHACLEYVLVHELVHLLECKHNERFMGFMDQFLSDWRERPKLLNRMPLDACQSLSFGVTLAVAIITPTTNQKELDVKLPVAMPEMQ